MAGYVVLAPEGIDLPNADAVLGDPNNEGTTTHYALNAEVPLSRLIPGQYQWLVQKGLIGETLVGAGGGGGGTWGSITGTISNQTDLNSALAGKQAADDDLTAIASIGASSGLLKKLGANSWTLDSATYLTANQTISLSGDLSGSGTTSINATLANSGVTANTYGSATTVPVVTVDAKGRITSASNTAITTFVFPVTDFGAVGNGTANDTTAIQNTINAAAASSTKATVWFPKGTYKVSATAIRSGSDYYSLQIPTGVTLVGAGKGLSTILLEDASGRCDVLWATGVNNISVSDLTIDAGARTGANYTTCIQFHNCDRVSLDNVEVTRGNIEGVYVYDSSEVQITGLLAHHNNTALPDAAGLHLDTCVNSAVTNVVSHNNGFHGMILSTCTNIAVSDLVAYDNGEQGLHVQTGTARCSFTGIVTYNNRRGVYIKDWNTTDNIFSGINAHHNDGDGILLNACEFNLLDGIVSHDNGENGIYCFDWGNMTLGSRSLLRNTLGSLVIDTYWTVTESPAGSGTTSDEMIIIDAMDAY